VTVDHIPSAELVDDVAARRPWWLPALDIDPDWRIDHGNFPHSLDPALREPEETP
jgi:hypothetical protein